MIIARLNHIRFDPNTFIFSAMSQGEQGDDPNFSTLGISEPHPEVLNQPDGDYLEDITGWLTDQHSKMKPVNDEIADQVQLFTKELEQLITTKGQKNLLVISFFLFKPMPAPF